MTRKADAFLIWSAMTIAACAGSCRPGDGAITGEIRTSSGAPAVDARVALAPAESDGAPLVTRTDSAGRYRLDAPPGRYRLAAGPEDHPTHSPRIIEVAPGTATDINLSLRLPRVRGRVRGIPAGTPPGLMRVEMISSEPPLEASIHSDGTFEFLDVPAGAKNLFLEPLGAYTPVTVSDMDLDNVELGPSREPGRPRILGRIRVEGGALLPRVYEPQSGGLRLEVRGSAGSAVSLFVRSDGALGLPDLPAGDYELRFVRLPAGYSVKSMTYGAADLLREPLRVASRDADRFLEITLTPPPSAHSPDGNVGSTLVVSNRGSLQLSGDTPLATFIELKGTSSRQETRLGGEWCGVEYPTPATVAPYGCYHFSPRSFDSLALSLAPGRYELRSYMRPYLGGGSPTHECGVSLVLEAGQTLYAERIEHRGCTVVTSSKPFRSWN
jgi:hypothetical protein